MNLRDFGTQARLSVILAIAGAVSAITAIALIARNFDATTFWVIYNPKRPLGAALMAALAASVVASGLGLWAGFNSAGQRRNPNPQLSWTGFFASAAAMTVALGAAIFFVITQNPRGA